MSSSESHHLYGLPHVLRNPRTPTNNIGKGGANGIGSALVRLIHAHGGLVVFGDINHGAGEQLASELGDAVSFVPVNVTTYEDHVRLFKTALAKHARVDHALSIAGINESDHSWFDDALDIQAVETPASDLTVDINLKGTMCFSRVALPYLRHSTSCAVESRKKSLTLLSSQLGVVPGFGIPLYQSSKHAVLGLSRRLSISAARSKGGRVNAILPGMTKTGMAVALREAWKPHKLLDQSPADVAHVLLATTLSEQHGAVDGGETWEIEKGLAATRSQWLGPVSTDTIEAIKKAFDVETLGDGVKVELAK